MIVLNLKHTTTDSLLLQFNNRESAAFSKIYVQFFDELNHFTERLFYSTTIESEDMIQDIFMTIWNNKKLKFTSIDHIKNYIYVCIKNNHKDFLRKKISALNYSHYVEQIENYQFSQEVETEVISLLHIADDILPKECAKVLKLHLEGYEIKEIATILDKSKFTIYNQQSEAISSIRKYLYRKKITFFLIFFNFI